MMDFENMDYDYDEEGDDVFNRPLEIVEDEEDQSAGGFQVSELFAQLTANPIYFGVAALVVFWVDPCLGCVAGKICGCRTRAFA
jgi:hypothetical protein